MKTVTVAAVIEVINGMGKLKINEMQIDDNLSDLGMDSIMFIQMIVALEEIFGCEIPDEKLIISEMDTVRKIIDVLMLLNNF